MRKKLRYYTEAEKKKLKEKGFSWSDESGTWEKSGGIKAPDDMAKEFSDEDKYRIMTDLRVTEREKARIKKRNRSDADEKFIRQNGMDAYVWKKAHKDLGLSGKSTGNLIIDSILDSKNKRAESFYNADKRRRDSRPKDGNIYPLNKNDKEIEEIRKKNRKKR